MATLNLGRIKPVFKGAYNNATAYVVDDIVTSGGSSYICILASTGNAVSNATYWTQMSSAGTNGTDVGTTITTQGDILYRDGSGLARLGAGTSGMFLKTQGTGANPVWAESGGKTLAFQNYQQTSRVVLSTTTSETSLMSGSFTQAKANTKLLVNYRFPFFADASGSSRTYFTYDSTKTFDAWSWDLSLIHI